MICSGETMRSGLPYACSHGCASPGTLRFDTLKPTRPAFGRAPRPVAPSSRISPPAPVEAPGNGEMAVGWLCVSTFISTWCVASRLPYGTSVTLDRLADRRALLSGMDQMRRELDASGQMSGLDAYSQQALGILTSSRLVEALLLARRPQVAANGLKFSFVTYRNSNRGD